MAAAIVQNSRPLALTWHTEASVCELVRRGTIQSIQQQSQVWWFIYKRELTVSALLCFHSSKWLLWFSESPAPNRLADNPRQYVCLFLFNVLQFDGGTGGWGIWGAAGGCCLHEPPQEVHVEAWTGWLYICFELPSSSFLLLSLDCFFLPNRKTDEFPFSGNNQTMILASVMRSLRARLVKGRDLGFLCLSSWGVWLSLTS